MKNYIHFIRFYKTAAIAIKRFSNNFMKTVIGKKDNHQRQAHNQYGAIGSSTKILRDEPNKILRRKPERKLQKNANSGFKKKQRSTSMEPVCYISHQNIKEGSLRNYRSESQYQIGLEQNDGPKRKRITSSPPLRPINKQFLSLPKVNTISIIRVKAAEKNENESIDSLKRQIQELKGINKILSQELNSTKTQKINQTRISQNLQEKINSLSQTIREHNKQIRQYKRQIKDHKKQLIDNECQMKNLKQQIQSISKKNLICNKILPSNQLNEKEQLERVLSDINRGFDEIFIDSQLVLSNQEHYIPTTNIILDEQNNRQLSDVQIYNLKQKIKYLQMEVRMLKKYKFQFKKLESEYQKYKSQMKILSNKFMKMEQNKLRNLEKERIRQKEKSKKKTVEQKSINKQENDNSISFDLSKDQTTLDL